MTPKKFAVLKFDKQRLVEVSASWASTQTQSTGLAQGLKIILPREEKAQRLKVKNTSAFPYNPASPGNCYVALFEGRRFMRKQEEGKVFLELEGT